MMIRIFLFLIATMFALPLVAAPKNDLAYDIVEGLTTEVGQRLAGTEAEARAREWAVVKLKTLGFSNVRVETYDMPVWVRGVETAEIMSPFAQKFAVTALGNSGSTGSAGVTLPVVAFTSLDALKAASPAAVKGRIVFVSHAMKAAQDGSGYATFGQARRAGPSIASKLGAAAFLVRSIGTDRSRDPHTGIQTWAEGVNPIPAGALSIADAENLERMMVRGKPVVMKLVLTPRQLGLRQSGNVIAEVAGRDVNAGIVLIGGHLDSWDLGTGALDDGAGIAITTAAAHAVMTTKPKALRTIRLVWWGAEEVGAFGGADYFTRHRNEQHVLVAESDNGADRIWRFDLKFPAGAMPLADRIAAALRPLGIPRGSELAAGGADIALFAAAGVPVIDLQQDSSRYFDFHHTASDTLDRIDPDQLAQNVAAWTIMLDHAANAPELTTTMPTGPQAKGAKTVPD